MKRGFIVGVDASRNRSGGAIAHLRGLLSGSDPRKHGIRAVHLWAYDDLRARVADKPWLFKHTVPTLKGPLWRQLWWQYSSLPEIVDDLHCDILFNTDAGSICPTRRSATLSQDLLSFEAGERARYGISLARLRLELLRSVQLRSLRRARLRIFLSDYARQTIEQLLRCGGRSVVIPHGIDERCRAVAGTRRSWPALGPVRCLYVSNAAPYKHQWHVVEAVAALRAIGYELELTLVGGGSGRAARRLKSALGRFDPARAFVKQEGHVPSEHIPGRLAQSDLFVFASSCENLPITLLEAMASGIPICSSNRGPMPEILGEGGCYFDPEQPASIANAIREAVDDGTARERRSADSLSRSREFTWRRCADETWCALARACQEER